eukprot:CAMPEP_0194386840 /NCGR_PEP_ID=MMETSP0174-20130528/88772_1 /TAXON_ID=216777 /ORGANISM="Proboscia alata, Strain PI-D3" /LENGTH=243 /DNA_ID=CAMNT_0039176429 /DNA_START=298 /DNA_END=1029 /DNA_ORIENTATION=-
MSMKRCVDLTTDDDSVIISPEKKPKHQQQSIKAFVSSETPPSTRIAPNEKQTYKIFCDLDGVLCDFEEGVKRIFNGRGTKQVSTSQMWSGINRTHGFYAKLPWTRDGRQLWDAIRPLNPDILTGVAQMKSTRGHKVQWCTRELGVSDINHIDMSGLKQAHQLVNGRSRRYGDNIVNVITCWSRNKHCESKRGAILIDDREDLGIKWVEKGGVFVHHTCTSNTLEKLKKLGVLQNENAEVINID